MSSIASSAGQPSTGNLGDEEPSLPKTLDNLDLRSYSLGRSIHQRGPDPDLLSINWQAAASTAQTRELSTEFQSAMITSGVPGQIIDLMTNTIATYWSNIPHAGSTQTGDSSSAQEDIDSEFFHLMQNPHKRHIAFL